MKGSVLVIMGSIAALLATACGQSGENAPTVDEYKQKRAQLMLRMQAGTAGSSGAATAQAGGESDDAALQATAGFSYDPVGKRDPFRSFVLERQRQLSDHERGPLEQFDLNQLEVTGVVWETNRPRAMIEDPSGRGYIVQEGTAIGKNSGFVVRIDDQTVLVRETYVDFLGEATIKAIEMRFRPTQGG